MTKGEFIKERRKRLKLTQEDVAGFVGVTKATVSRWESGDIQKMKAEMLDLLCRKLMIDPMIIVRDEVIFDDELELINAYRSMNDYEKSAVRRILNIKEETT